MRAASAVAVSADAGETAPPETGEPAPAEWGEPAPAESGEPADPGATADETEDSDQLQRVEV